MEHMTKSIYTSSSFIVPQASFGFAPHTLCLQLCFVSHPGVKTSTGSNLCKCFHLCRLIKNAHKEFCETIYTAHIQHCSLASLALDKRTIGSEGRRLEENDFTDSLLLEKEVQPLALSVNFEVENRSLDTLPGV